MRGPESLMRYQPSLRWKLIKTSHLLRNMKSLNQVHKISPLCPIKIHIHPLHILKFHFLKDMFLHSTLIYPSFSWFISSFYVFQVQVHISLVDLQVSQDFSIFVIKTIYFKSTGLFIMFFVITNIYNKKNKGPTLMELFTATGKLKKFLLTTRDVRCVHHGEHGTHRYDIQVLGTQASACVVTT